MYDDTYHADQIICRNLIEITPSSVLCALRHANRERRVFDVDIWHHYHTNVRTSVSIIEYEQPCCNQMLLATSATCTMY
jgi:hypothetical protein